MKQPTEKEYLDAIRLAPYDSASVKLLESLVKRHFRMIQHMKETSLWDIYEYENRVASSALEPMQYLAFENERMKKEINKLRKQLGMCEKYKIFEEE